MGWGWCLEIYSYPLLGMIFSYGIPKYNSQIPFLTPTLLSSKLRTKNALIWQDVLCHSLFLDSRSLKFVLHMDDSFCIISRDITKFVGLDLPVKMARLKIYKVCCTFLFVTEGVYAIFFSF